MSPKTSEPRVALVYDHLITSFGGAEVVLQHLMTAFPDAPVFTTIYDARAANWIAPERVRPVVTHSWLVALLKKRELLDTLAPLLVEQHDFSGFDVVLSVTATAAKGVLTLPNQLHISYIFTPPRYLYHQAEELSAGHAVMRLPGIRNLARAVLKYLRWWDQVAAQRPDEVLTLSEHVAARIQITYDRSATVLYPPLPELKQTVKKSAPAVKLTPGFYLSLARLVPYKRIDLAVQAAVRTGHKLVVAGAGSERERLENSAGQSRCTRASGESLEQTVARFMSRDSTVIFLGQVSELQKEWLLSSAQALIMTGIEDFGITAVEAAVHQLPVLLHAESGAAELFKPDEVVLITDQSVAAVAAGFEELLARSITAQRAEELAQKLSASEFVRKIHNIVFQTWKNHVRMSSYREVL